MPLLKLASPVKNKSTGWLAFKLYEKYKQGKNPIRGDYTVEDLTKAAFDTSKNVALRLQASIQLAETYEVSEQNIIRNANELDAFMLS